MSFKAKWIKPKRDFGDICPTYVREFTFEGEFIGKATLTITAMGMYEAELNGTRIGEYVFAPGWTSPKRLQYQSYDVSHLIQEKNTLTITVGKGWLRSPLATRAESEPCLSLPSGVSAILDIGRLIETDSSWHAKESPVRFSEIYDGEVYDANITSAHLEAVEEIPAPDCDLVPQEGEEIREQDVIIPVKIIKTPKGETVIDFGQNLTGYIALNLPENTQAGHVIELSFAEVLDKEGNFYTENYRAAKSKLKYICREGRQSYKPKFTFYGFRYIRLDSFPFEAESLFHNMTASCCSGGFQHKTPISAIAIHSEMERTGFFSCSSHLVNRLYENTLWGQKGNFLDVPTDCPQRDERLGWTGDAQVFIKTAAYNYDVEKFFTKWLADLALEQQQDGQVPHVVPDTIRAGGSAAWGDAATICPWNIYLAYGNKEILERQFTSMHKWVDYITSATQDTNLWTGGTHFGDWLSIEVPVDPAVDCQKIGTRHDFIASAFYAHSVSLVVKAGKVLGRDISAYEALHVGIVNAFKKTYNKFYTQTEYVLALQFDLVDDHISTAKALADKVMADGCHLTTGFPGTPYLLHVLSENGQADLAYTLLLREEYPSWLYPVTKGATTVWERWDSIKPDGSFQTESMNSFNHYAYGAVVDWLYSVAAGIRPTEDAPGYKKVHIAPKPDTRLGWVSAKYKTRHGWVQSKWQYIEGGTIRYDIETPVEAEICVSNQKYTVGKGAYTFYERLGEGI